jgi:c-di-AMP phosphodiesterase-like protein
VTSHRDFHLDNIVRSRTWTKTGMLGLIDFDFTSVTSAIHDLVSMTALCGDHLPRLKRSFLIAYLQELGEQVDQTLETLLVHCELGKLSQDRGQLVEWHSEFLLTVQQFDNLVVSQRFANRVRADAAMQDRLIRF